MNLITKLSYPRFFALTILSIILIGTALLCLPVATKAGVATPFIDALYTATSATCVTGLIQFNTGEYWSLFGQIVILVMIQIGGIGLMTLITMVSLALKRRIGLRERRILEQSAGSTTLSGIIKLIRRVVKGTALFEGVGAFLLCFRFVPAMGFAKGVYTAIFISISAFCNAGFDVLGNFRGGSSLSAFNTDAYVMLVVAALIIVGGIGFVVWTDCMRHRFHFNRYMLTSKIAITMSFILLVGGTIALVLTEWNTPVLAHMSAGEKFLNCFFTSTTARTAGFAGYDLTQMTDAGKMIEIVLMFIGGSPGSTAGGIKTTTFAVMLFTVCSLATGKRYTCAFNRRIGSEFIRASASIVSCYIMGVLAVSVVVSAIDGLPMMDVLFESVSAAATVGLSLNVSPLISTVSKILYIGLMFGGRIGGMTFLLMLAEHRPEPILKRPEEKLLIG